MSLDDIEILIDAERPATAERATEMLAAGEAVIEHWLRLTGRDPTDGVREGYRLLALQRQGAVEDPSFNACRETCRELVFHYNVAHAAGPRDDLVPVLRMMRFVARHLLLFVGGKLVERGLGDFCCASRPLRRGEG